MNDKDQILENKVKQETEFVKCTCCRKKLKREEAWYSRNNDPYCNKEYCFWAYTDDG